MKAISLWQPWASAMALGLKSIETRHWVTSYRGPMAIHAAKRWTAEEREFAAIMGLPAELPLGAVVAIGQLSQIHHSEHIRDEISEQERAWGNYADGRFGWRFIDVTALPEPIPYRGAQGLFEIPDELLGMAPADKPQGQLL